MNGYRAKAATKFLLAEVVATSLLVTNVQAQQFPENVAHSSIYCGWQIYVGLQAVGKMCSFDENSDFSHFLQESIAKMDNFLVANSLATADQLATTKAATAKGVADEAAKMGPTELAKSCAKQPSSSKTDDDTAVTMYKRLESVDPTKFREEVAGLLSLEEALKPTPCL